MGTTTLGFELGTIKGSKEIGKSKGGRYILVQCPICLQNRWLQMSNFHKAAFNKLREVSYCKNCHVCALKSNSGSRNYRWVGGRVDDGHGYKQIKLEVSDPYFCMAQSNRYVMEHRLVMAKYLSRPLEQWEVVHHKNGEKKDNRIENLELLPEQSDHVAIQNMTKHIKDLELRVTLLEAENEVLRKQLGGV